MYLTTQQSISVLSKWKKYFSKLKSYFQSNGLYKEGVENLYKEINDNLPSAGIEIGKYNKLRLQNIFSNFNRNQNYSSNSGECEFIVNLITNIDKDIDRAIDKHLEIETLKEKQKSVQKKLDAHKKDVKPSIMKPKKRKEYNEKKEDLKSQLHEAIKVKWQAILDQKFEQNSSMQLDEIAENIGSNYISKLIDKTNRGGNNKYSYIDVKTRTGFQYRTLAEILNRDNPTYEDKRILLKWDIYQVEMFLKDKTLTEGDEKALKEIYQDLKKEKDKSKKDFNPKNEGYIQESKGTRSAPQSTFQKALVQQGQRDMATSSL